MAELELANQGEASKVGISGLDKAFLGAACIGAVLGAYAGYKLVDAEDDNELAVATHNAELEKCLDLSPEQQLVGCAPKLIYYFGLERYVNIDSVSLSAGGTLVPVISTNVELLKKDLEDSKEELGFEPENPAYKVVGAVVGGAVGVVVGAGLFEGTVGAHMRRRNRNRRITVAV